jgi:hypothetical protein
VPLQAWFNNDIVGHSRGGDGSVDGATIRIYSEGPEDSPSRQLAMFAARIGAIYVPSHRVRLMARADRFSRGGDHSALNAAGLRRDRLPRVEGELREAARAQRHDRRRRFPLPGAERARQRRRDGDARARAAAARRRHGATALTPTIDRRRRATTRTCAGKRRRRGRLPRLLAQRLGARLGARVAVGSVTEYTSRR